MDSTSGSRLFTSDSRGVGSCLILSLQITLPTAKLAVDWKGCDSPPTPTGKTKGKQTNQSTYKHSLLQRAVRPGTALPSVRTTQQKRSARPGASWVYGSLLQAAILACFSPQIPSNLCFSERCSVTLLVERFLCLMLVIHMCNSPSKSASQSYPCIS